MYPLGNSHHQLLNLSFTPQNLCWTIVSIASTHWATLSRLSFLIPVLLKQTSQKVQCQHFFLAIDNLHNSWLILKLCVVLSFLEYLLCHTVLYFLNMCPFAKLISIPPPQSGAPLWFWSTLSTVLLNGNLISPFLPASFTLFTDWISTLFSGRYRRQASWDWNYYSEISWLQE